MQRLACVFLSLACCSPSQPSRAPEPTPAPATAPTPAAAPAPPAEPTGPDPVDGELLWSAADLDLDGDGSADPVTVSSPHAHLAGPDGYDDDPRVPIKVTGCTTRCDAVVRVGDRVARMPLNAGDYFGGLGVTPVDIDATDGRTELVFVQRGGDGEDPPYVFWVALYDGTDLTLTRLWSSTGYNSGEVHTDGHGHLVVVYDECPDAFTVQYALADGRLEAGPVQTRRVRNPDTCAACPHVYVHQADGAFYKGEILRNLDRATLRGTQSLALRNPQRFARTDGAITVELREEKPETTYLFAVWLEVDGARVDPAGFTPLVLEQGDTVQLAFPVPALDRASSVSLWADGYYEPRPSR